MDEVSTRMSVKLSIGIKLCLSFRENLAVMADKETAGPKISSQYAI